jgi:hypothetical protein
LSEGSDLRDEAQPQEGKDLELNVSGSEMMSLKSRFQSLSILMNTFRCLHHVKKIATLSSEDVTESALKINHDNPAHNGGIDLIGFEAFHIVYKKRGTLYRPFGLFLKTENASSGLL